MTYTVYELSGVRVLECEPHGPLIQGERDAADLVGDMLSEGVELVVIPVERLGDQFFDLRTRTAGEVLQKLVSYRRRVAIVGDISGYLSGSKAPRDFVYESNRGHEIWFLTDLDELRTRLEAARTPD